MYISEISLNNFRGFNKSTKICFTKGTNVIIGPNNSGKTTVIKALELLFNTEKSKNLSIYDFNRDVDISTLKNEPPKIIITGKLVESENEKDYSEDLVTVATWLTKIDKPYEALITYEFSLPDKEIEEYKEALNKINSNDIEDYWNEIEYRFIRKYSHRIYVGNPLYKTAIDSETLKKFDFQFVTAIRDVERDMYSGRNSLLKEVIDFFIDYEIKTDIKLEDKEKKEAISKRKEEFSKDASKLITTLQDRMKFGKKQMLKYAEETGATFEKLQPSFDGKILDTELYSALKLIVENETGIKLPANQNGLGYNNLIYISLLLAKMQKNASGEYLGSNSKVFSMLVIEEPEAHLHPNMQYKFLKFLNKNKEHEVRQIFITSHSPNITAAVDLNDLIVLCKENQDIMVAYPGKVFSESREDQISKKYVQRFLDVTKSDMFFAKGLIFVEGIAEQLLIPEFAKMLKCDLFDSHISIINVGGRYFNHFLKLFDCKKSQYAIYRKVACITDLDPVRKKKTGEDSKWEACLPILLNCDKKVYDYKECSNDIVNTYSIKKSDAKIRVYSQEKGCTFEYELILQNPTCKELLMDTVSNKSEIESLMDILEKGKGIDEIIKKLGKGKFKEAVVDAINKTTIAPEEELIKHIIAGRYLKSIKKGEAAQEIACTIAVNEEQKSCDSSDTLESTFKLEVPTYIREAIQWIYHWQ